MDGVRTDVEVTWIAPWAVALPGSSGGSVPPDDELLEQTLAFSGSYVSDDGTVTITRSAARASAYAGDRFVGRCTVCARGQLLPAEGESLAGIPEVVRFVSTHDHADLD